MTYRNRRSLWALVVLGLLVGGQGSAAPATDKSDLNGDGVVDALDLEFFSNLYLEQDYQTVDWCAFYQSSIENPKYFRRVVSDKPEYYQQLFDYIVVTYDCPVTQPEAADKSDLNADGVVDLEDVKLFGTNYLGRNWELVDWCVFHGAVLAGADFEGQPTDYYLKHFTQLLDFINVYFTCGGEPPPPNGLLLENTPKYLARIATSPLATGDFYISDPMVGSVFVYDEFLTLKAEVKGLGKPLGVAIDLQGNLLVGNNGRNNVEVYDTSTGVMLTFFGQDVVSMPTAITLDSAGNIYVTDSQQHRVFIFDSTYNLVKTIGKPGVGPDTLKFPTDAEILPSTTGGTAGAMEVFVADQGNNRVQVFDLDGNWLRSLTFGGVEGQNCSWFTGVCEIPGMPPFTKVQALASDSFGRLHVLDNFAAAVHIFDPADGTYVESLGGYGSTAGLLRVPMDVVVSTSDMAIVTAGDGDRIEIYSVPQ